MPRKGLGIYEALSLLEELPSDPESIISEDESDVDENILITRGEGAIALAAESDDEEEDANDERNLPGPSRVTEVTWIKKSKVRKLIPEFSEKQGPSEEISTMENPTPINIFLSIFTFAFMEKIAFETNLYATQKGKPFSPVTVDDILTFIALNLLMGIKKLPSYRDFWSTNELLHDTYISKQMPVKKFSWILGNLHLNDNSIMPKRGEKNFDKLYKLRPLLSHLSERFLSLYRPGKNQSVDESMILFKGRSSLKQYMPKKPIKWGYKVWMRCDESGYCCQFDIYSGKTDGVETNLGERVVKTLSASLFGKNHRVYMDNYFTSYELFRFLQSKNVYCCGTVNMSRKNLPKTLLEDKKLKRGDFDWAISSDNITCLKWKDKRCVTLLSSLDDPVQCSFVERKGKDGQKLQVQCPQAIKDYNTHMGYVDYFDQMKSLYEIDRKSKKWWHRIFFHFLDVSLVNAFIIYRMLPDSDSSLNTLKLFRMDIIESLISMCSNPNIKRKMSSSPVTIKKRKSYVSDEKRLKNVEHMPIKCKSRRCAFCSTREKPHRTSFMCKLCNVGLCMYQKDDVTCFEKFHL